MIGAPSISSFGGITALLKGGVVGSDRKFGLHEGRDQWIIRWKGGHAHGFRDLFKIRYQIDVGPSLGPRFVILGSPEGVNEIIDLTTAT